MVAPFNLISVVVTFENEQGVEVEWRGDFTSSALEHLWSDFGNACEGGSYEYYEDGEEVVE